MRLGTLITGFGPRTVAQHGDELVELPGSVRELLAGGRDAARRAYEGATTSHSYDPSHDPSHLGPAVPGKFLCVGRNYVDHVQELGGSEPPGKPEVFIRARTSLTGPYQPVHRPRVSEMMDWEVELAVVIGRCGWFGARHAELQHLSDGPSHP